MGSPSLRSGQPGVRRLYPKVRVHLRKRPAAVDILGRERLKAEPRPRLVRWRDARCPSRRTRRRGLSSHGHRRRTDHRAICRPYRLRVGAGGDPRAGISAQARRPGVAGQRHRREVPPRYRQPAPRSRPHAGPRRHRGMHGGHAYPAGRRRPGQLSRTRGASRSATFSPARRSPPAPSTSPSAAA